MIYSLVVSDDLNINWSDVVKLGTTEKLRKAISDLVINKNYTTFLHHQPEVAKFTSKLFVFNVVLSAPANDCVRARLTANCPSGRRQSFFSLGNRSTHHQERRSAIERGSCPESLEHDSLSLCLLFFLRHTALMTIIIIIGAVSGEWRATGRACGAVSLLGLSSFACCCCPIFFSRPSFSVFSFWTELCPQFSG